MLSNLFNWQALILLGITTYHLIASIQEKSKIPTIGKLIDVGGHKLHFYSAGEGKITIILDNSLGGIDGYFLVDELAKISRVCIYDRAGYGSSQSSNKPRTSEQIVKELHILLQKAEIEPPYVLVGNSFGSYNMRLYAHLFPEEVVGMVLTDGLHEKQMLAMSFSLQLLKLFFTVSFLIASLGAALGVVRFLGIIGAFEILKKELRQFPKTTLKIVKSSFYSGRHWLTMFREMWSLNTSSHQVEKANDFGNMPIINIKAATFLKPGLGRFYFSIQPADKLRDAIQSNLLLLSTDCEQFLALKSGHFVWIDQQEVILAAVRKIFHKNFP
ncbi:alpha/beta hydrolase [Anabaena sphaerica FACHB-251]|uniref:Alpha/beta hydrolase n=1 Tax=Anabaena sphaerica FACHB-251 TaxID=2692883 RepID=A0A926WGY5_9NOST|nr:alpha/beta hydrolase [Anabaena sphaerica]MBD2292933.1 alpha/beta hydrolase [Anabaena sphaerica FACHB-251]